MTIKFKLIANIVVTAAIIIGISLAVVSSMRYLQEKLSYVAEKSSPFQMRTVELQRELQSCITHLVKVNASQTIQEYGVFRNEAEISLGNAEKYQRALEKMNAGTRLGITEELSQISGELFSAAEARITSDVAASDANVKVSRLMKDSSDRLKKLESHIRTLQVSHAALFAKALEDTGRLSVRLRDLEELRNNVKELIPVSSSALNTSKNTTFLIAKGKAKTLVSSIASNKSSKVISSEIRTLTDDMTEFLQLQSDALSQKNDGSRKWAAESLAALTEHINHMNLILNQEIELASSQLAIETNKQRSIFAQSNSANNILLSNSELVALGLTITGQINHLFTLTSPTELDKYAAEIRALFASVNERAQHVERSLAGLDAIDELNVLKAAIGSLTAIRSELYSPDGIVATLRTKLKAGEEAGRSADRLRALVIKQTAKSREGVSAAQGEQEKSIAAVNNMVSASLSRVIVIASMAIIIGILFGFWIYQSVLVPLRVIQEAVSRQREQGNEKACLAEAIAGGDLDREVVINDAIVFESGTLRHDEMGLVLNAVVGMSQAQATLDRALAGMTASLRNSRDEENRRNRLKSGLYELSNILRNEQSADQLADRALSFIASFLGAGVGIIYRYDEKEGMLQTLSTYAVSRSKRLNGGFRLGEGLAGQVAAERKMISLTTIPANYLPITSALGETDPLHISIVPIMHNHILAGVMELGSLRRFDDDDIAFLNQSLEGIAIAISISRSHQLVGELLEQTQAQAEELRVQQEELQQANEELIEQAHIRAEQRMCI